MLRKIVMNDEQKDAVMGNWLSKKVADRLMSTMMPLLPKRDMGHWVGHLVHQPLPEPLRVASMRAFVNAYQINLDEAEKAIEDYKSIGDLFTRRLKAGVRPIGHGMVHPADSVVASCGLIQGDGEIEQVKGLTYSVKSLIGEAQDFAGGFYATYYLCPTDYHRVHAPCDMDIVGVRHIPGAFWPVNNWSVKNVPGLYGINERVVFFGKTPMGESVVLVMVAATNVGNIQVAWDPEFAQYRARGARSIRDKEYPGLKLKKGDELGLFAMGSSVVMLIDKSVAKSLMAKDAASIANLTGVAVKVGQSIVKSS